MSTDDDVARLRGDVSELYGMNRDIHARVVKLEADSANRDDKIDELKNTIRELETMVRDGMASLSLQISAIAQAPAQKIASRWEGALSAAITAIVGAALLYIGSGIGLPKK